MMKHGWHLWVPLWFAGLSACNIFSVVDKPSGDAQILAAARACFDKGDFTCATTYYGQLSSASSDTSVSETALKVLSQNGVDMATLMSATVSYGSDGGKFITSLAGSLSSGSGQTKRLEIFHAYQQHASISDTRLKNLVRFLTSVCLLAEILGENVTTTGTFLASDLVKNVTTCRAATTASWVSPPSTLCEASSASTYKLVVGTTFTLSATSTDAQLSGSPSLTMIQTTLSEVSAALTALGTSSGFGSSSLSSVNNIINAGLSPTVPPGDRFLVWALITNNIGAAL